jgi:hypothetical protein
MTKPIGKKSTGSRAATLEPKPLSLLDIVEDLREVAEALAEDYRRLLRSLEPPAASEDLPKAAAP